MDGYLGFVGQHTYVKNSSSEPRNKRWRDRTSFRARLISTIPSNHDIIQKLDNAVMTEWRSLIILYCQFPDALVPLVLGYCSF
jgi:hypothetical protein